jgi:hypothetical protein
MSSLVADGLISPELVLVAPPDEAEEARAALPDVYEFYEWIAGLRALVVSEPLPESVDDNNGLVWFTLSVCSVALAPLVLIILWRALA